MKKLILTTNDSSAGRIKAARVSDRVVGICQRLVAGPLPSEAKSVKFFGSAQLEDELQDDNYHWQSSIGFPDRRRLGTLRPSLIETCQDYDRVEIWTDPDPNSYLILFQLIDAIKSRQDILDRLSLAFPSQYVGNLSEAEFENTRPLVQPLTSEHLDLASRAWHAHRSETPEAWFALLHGDMTAVPGLRTHILHILGELPSATNGLTATEAQLLTLINRAGANHSTVFTHYLESKPRPTLDYWEAGRRIVTLARCEPPVIIGVEEDSFSLDLHDDKVRFDAYCQKTWSLSRLGQRFLEGSDDLADFILIERWLGNTHLTPDRLWRWDGPSETLIEPR